MILLLFKFLTRMSKLATRLYIKTTIKCQILIKANWKIDFEIVWTLEKDFITITIDSKYINEDIGQPAKKKVGHYFIYPYPFYSSKAKHAVVPAMEGMIYDTDNKAVKVIENSNKHHAHGTCHPIGILEAQDINAVICKGMGARAVQALNKSGIWAYKADGETVEDIVAEYKKNKLNPITVKNACKDHNCHTSQSPDYTI